VFLVTQQGWSQSSVGFVTTIGSLIGLAADLMRGTGRYNLALGAVATAQGLAHS